MFIFLSVKNILNELIREKIISKIKYQNFNY